MKYVTSTYKIVYGLTLDNYVEQEWIDWALEMLSAGYESESILYLDSFDLYDKMLGLRETINKALKDIGIDHSNHEMIIKSYADYIIESALNKEVSVTQALSMLKQMCLEQNWPKYLINFYSLYHAKIELGYSDSQYAWEGANKNNIDQIINKYFLDWSAKVKVSLVVKDER
jgi:hypothetical protein